MNVTGREVEFHWWNSPVPLLELWNSTGGTHDFHYWNSLSSLVREIISFNGLVELGRILVARLLISSRFTLQRYFFSKKQNYGQINLLQKP